jgi:hypothetical protein
MSEKTIFETYRDEMQKIAESIAKPIGATVEESGNDEYGFEFASEREDGNVLLVTLTVTPSTQGKEAGNFILRANGNDDETVINWGPDNHTDRCWAPYADKDAWSSKLDTVRAHSSELVDKIQAWQSAVSPKP